MIRQPSVVRQRSAVRILRSHRNHGKHGKIVAVRTLIQGCAYIREGLKVYCFEGSRIYVRGCT